MRDILPELLDFEVVCLDGDKILFTEGFQCDFIVASMVLYNNWKWLIQQETFI